MSLATVINKALDIRKEEQKVVYLLLLQTFFIGIFFAIFDISATSLFINTYGEELIPQAFLISGIAGFLLTAAYFRLQKIMSFSTLTVLNLLTVTIITFLLRLSFFYSENEYLIFVVFVLMGPLNLLALVSFWGMAGRLFSLRQGKRLYGLIDSGQILGIIIISLSVPFLLNMFSDEKDLLFVSASSIFLAFILQLIISSNFSLNTVKKETKKEKTNLFKLLRNKYVLYMALFVVFSMLAAFFMFYSFLPVTKAKYPDSEAYTSFLALFMVALYTFTLLFKVFASSKLLKTYGLKVNLILPGAILGIFTILAIVVGSIFGYTADSTSFILFFLLISLGRLLSVSMKSSIEVPSQKLLYQSLDSKLRYSVQAAIDGMVNEVAAILAGVILLALSFLDFIEIIHYSYGLLLILTGWLFVGYKLYQEYRKSLEVSLGKKHEITNITSSDLQIADSFTESNNLIFEYLEYLNPENLEANYAKLLQSDNTYVRKLALESIRANCLVELANNLKPYIGKEENPDLRQDALAIVNDLENVSSREFQYQLADLVHSVNPKERLKAVNSIVFLENEENYHYLVILLRDFSPEVRIAAIKAAGKIKHKDFIPVIVDYLSSSSYNVYAYNTLKSYGEDAFDSLEQYFYKSGLDANIQIQLVKLFGDSRSQNAIPFLINKLNFHNRYVVIEICRSLKNCGYVTHSEHEKQQLHQLLEENIKVTAWNINILNQLQTEELSAELKQAFEKEVEENYSVIFLLLSIKYDPSSIQNVKENLETGTSESINFAIELLDLFIDERIKPLLFTLFEDISDTDRIKRFQDQFPLEKYNQEEIINSIINRDNNYISRWTKAIAINNIERIDNYNVDNSIIAQLFNPDRFISELAAKTIYQVDKKLFHNTLERLDKQTEKEFSALPINNSLLIFEKIEALKESRVFEDISESLIVELFEHSRNIYLQKSEALNNKEKFKALYFVNKGMIVTDTEGNTKQYKENEYFLAGEKSTISANENSYITELKLDAIFSKYTYKEELTSMLKVLIN